MADLDASAGPDVAWCSSAQADRRAARTMLRHLVPAAVAVSRVDSCHPDLVVRPASDFEGIPQVCECYSVAAMPAIRSSAPLPDGCGHPCTEWIIAGAPVVRHVTARHVASVDVSADGVDYCRACALVLFPECLTVTLDDETAAVRTAGRFCPNRGIPA
jgi:hypothetical protein